MVFSANPGISNNKFKFQTDETKMAPIWYFNPKSYGNGICFEIYYVASSASAPIVSNAVAADVVDHPPNYLEAVNINRV